MDKVINKIIVDPEYCEAWMSFLVPLDIETGQYINNVTALINSGAEFKKKVDSSLNRTQFKNYPQYFVIYPSQFRNAKEPKIKENKSVIFAVIKNDYRNYFDLDERQKGNS